MSVPNERLPVEPTVTGSRFREVGRHQRWRRALQVLTPRVIVAAPVSGREGHGVAALGHAVGRQVGLMKPGARTGRGLGEVRAASCA